MTSFKRVCFLAGGAAALLAAFPAQAEEVTAPATAGFDLSNVLAAEPEIAVEEVAEFELAQPEVVADQTLDEYLAESGALVSDDAELTAAEGYLEIAEATEDDVVAQDVAQVTRPLYRGVSPFYIGVGGNIGIIDSGKSAVGDFGFNIFSKVSLGPRFAVRPMLQFSEDEFNVTLPITFNFNPIELKGFSIYPSLGGGVDFGSDIGLLINGGVDVPISRDFTLNSQVNWRVTEDTGLGVSLGVGYNFPIFFE